MVPSLIARVPDRSPRGLSNQIFLISETKRTGLLFLSVSRGSSVRDKFLSTVLSYIQLDIYLIKFFSFSFSPFFPLSRLIYLAISLTANRAILSETIHAQESTTEAEGRIS